jgi:hypothetical protein
MCINTAETIEDEFFGIKAGIIWNALNQNGPGTRAKVSDEAGFSHAAPVKAYPS